MLLSQSSFSSATLLWDLVCSVNGVFDTSVSGKRNFIFSNHFSLKRLRVSKKCSCIRRVWSFSVRSLNLIQDRKSLSWWDITLNVWIKLPFYLRSFWFCSHVLSFLFRPLLGLHLQKKYHSSNHRIHRHLPQMTVPCLYLQNHRVILHWINIIWRMVWG